MTDTGDTIREVTTEGSINANRTADDPEFVEADGQQKTQEADKPQPKAKGKPNVQEAYRRVKDENKDLKNRISASEERQSLLEMRLQDLEKQKVAEPDPDDDLSTLIDDEPDEFITAGKTKIALTKVGSELAEIKRQFKDLSVRYQNDARAGFMEKIKLVNKNGAERWEDWEEVADSVNRDAQVDPGIWQLILNSPDPARKAYSIGMGSMPETAGTPARTNTRADRIAANEAMPGSLSNVPAGTGGTGMTVERLVNLPPEEYVKVDPTLRKRLISEYEKKVQTT